MCVLCMRSNLASHKVRLPQSMNQLLEFEPLTNLGKYMSDLLDSIKLDPPQSILNISLVQQFSGLHIVSYCCTPIC